MQFWDDLRCPVCPGTTGRLERTLDGYRLVRCAACGMVYIWPRPSREASRASYAEGMRGKPATSTPEAAPDRERECLEIMRSYDLEYNAYTQPGLALRLQRVTRSRRVRRMLDFGCGAGHLLALARRLLGCETFGVEIHPVARMGAERFGFQLHGGPLEEAPFENESFDLIYSGQVFEHLPEPRVELTLLWRFLAPGGLLYIEVPNYRSLSIRLGRDRFVRNRPPGHLNYFTPATLRKLVLETHFDIVFQRTTGLNHRALLGRDRKDAQADAAASADRVAASSCLGPTGEIRLARRRRLKLRALAVVDRILSVPGWGMQNEIVCVRPRKRNK